MASSCRTAVGALPHSLGLGSAGKEPQSEKCVCVHVRVCVEGVHAPRKEAFTAVSNEVY